jgi:hypothetical protein
MSRWMMASALAVTVLQAQPLVVVTPVSDSLPGLTLLGPSDPAFLPAVQALIGAPNFPAYQPVLPYSVLVRNDTSQPIIDPCVIFDVTQVNGKRTAPWHRAMETFRLARGRDPISVYIRTFLVENVWDRLRQPVISARY